MLAGVSKRFRTGPPWHRRTVEVLRDLSMEVKLTGQAMLPVFDYPNPLGCADVPAPPAMSASARVGSVSGR